jgi:arylformamidase
MTGWIDLTRRLDDRLVCWPGRRLPNVRWDKRIEDGHHCNVSVWSLEAHTGTHIDAPRHFVAEGQPIEQISLETLTGPCELVEISAEPVLTLTIDEAQSRVGVRRLLIRTGFGEDGSFSDHPALLTPGAAALLLGGGLALIGTDRLSVDASTVPDFTLHRLLLGSGCVIIEGLSLGGIAPGSYELCALPLPIAGAEASPARVLIRAAGVS